MDAEATAGGPAPTGAAGVGPDDRTVWERFTDLVRCASDLNDDERERVLDLGLRALHGDAGLGVV